MSAFQFTLSLFCLPVWYDARNDVLTCWIGPTNCQPGDSELEVQRYGIKKTTLTIDPIMLEDEMWMRQHQKPFPNRRSQFLENQTAKIFGFWIMRSARFSSVLENRYPTFSLRSAHPEIFQHIPGFCLTGPFSRVTQG